MQNVLLDYECNMLLWTFYELGFSALILNAKARDPANNNWEIIPQKSTFLRVAMRNTAPNSSAVASFKRSFIIL